MTSVVYGPALPPCGHIGTFQNFKIIIARTHQSIEKEPLCHQPSVVPSSPMMIFMEVIICWAIGGDMEVA